MNIGSRRVHSRALVLVGSGSLSLRVTTSGLNVQTWFVKLSTTDVKLGHRPKSEIRHSTAIYVSALLLKRFSDSQKSQSQRTHLLQMLKYETRGMMFCISEDQLNAKTSLRRRNTHHYPTIVWITIAGRAKRHSRVQSVYILHRETYRNLTRQIKCFRDHLH